MLIVVIAVVVVASVQVWKVVVVSMSEALLDGVEVAASAVVVDGGSSVLKVIIAEHVGSIAFAVSSRGVNGNG